VEQVAGERLGAVEAGVDEGADDGVPRQLPAGLLQRAVDEPELPGELRVRVDTEPSAQQIPHERGLLDLLVVLRGGGAQQRGEACCLHGGGGLGHPVLHRESFRQCVGKNVSHPRGHGHGRSRRSEAAGHRLDECQP
jgi:hypothetical protein